MIHNDLVNDGIKPFSVVEIQNTVKKLKNSKAPDIFGIITELLKNVTELHCSGTILLWLQMLFNAIWDQPERLTYRSDSISVEKKSFQEELQEL